MHCLEEHLSSSQTEKIMVRALVDMWAYLCDILTYYQERVATESFLRTAGLEESVIELLYLVDYLPRRGRSASTLVRFMANEKNIHPTESVVIPKGFKIRSIPAKGQESIIFETDEPLDLSSDHNLMKLEGWRTSYRIQQGTTQLILDKIYPELNIGDLVMISDDRNIDVIRITKKVDKDGKSQITWAEDKGLHSDYNLSNTRIQKFTQVVRPFGYNAPPSILSNVGVILYKKNPNTEGGSGSSGGGGDGIVGTNTDENRERVPGRLVQLVDVSDRVIASAVSDKDGKFSFRSLIPGSYRILIARSKLITNEGQLHPITTISTNRFQLLPGFESWFDAELEFGGTEIQNLASRWKDFLSKLAQENPFAEEGFTKIINSILPADIERMANDNLPDLRPTLNLTPKEPYPFDPVNDDIINSQIYLDKVYGNIRQGSFVILSKDDPSNQIDIPRQLFKVSRTGQIFHTRYGIGGNATTINLQRIDGEEEGEAFIFCWSEVLAELKEIEKTPTEEREEKVSGKETKKLIEFLNQDIHSLDTKTATLKEIENGTSILISDQNKKNVYLIKLNEKDEGKATLFKNDKKLLDFIVRREGEEGGGEGDSEKKTNLYARRIESAFYKIRNTLIFTNPLMALGVDPRDASQDKTVEHAEKITLEGMHTRLKAGVFVAINDNTSIIQGRLVDDNLRPLQGYRVAVYRIQSQEGAPSSLSIAATPTEVTFEFTNSEGSFIFDDLRAESYLISVSLPLDRYWSIFVDYIFGGQGGENERTEIINALLPKKDKKLDKEYDQSLTEVVELHLKAFLELIEIIKRKGSQNKPSDLESRYAVYTADILASISEIETIFREAILLPFLEAGSIETAAGASSSSSSASLLNKSSEDTISSIEQKLEPKLHELESKTQQVLNRMPNDRVSTSISFVREFAEKTIIMRMLPILNELVITIKEALQDPFRSKIYEKNEHLLGLTKPLNLESNTSTNITMTFDINGGLTYVESMLQYSKFQVTKISGAPTFSEGKTHLNLNPVLKYRYVKGFAEIYGNIAPASHGETVKDEILGSGDASAIHQEFTLRKGPLSYVPSPFSPDGIKSTLKVIVNDVQWEETEDFLDSSPNDHHYVTSLNEDGSIKITFGDGIRGSTLPTGVDNIHVQYRIGMGFKGNLQPDTPVVAQENNPAIKSISIPAGSYGGAEKLLSQLKRSYRAHILTLGRAISLEDYSNLATTFGEISKARAYLLMKAGRETVVLVVAGQRGRIAILLCRWSCRRIWMNAET